MEENQLISEFLSLVGIEGYKENYQRDVAGESYFGLPLKSIIASEKRLRSDPERCLAYFSMEYGLATSFYNKFNAVYPIDPSNKIQEHEVFSNFRLADYFFSLKTDNRIDLPIYSGGLGVLAGDTIKTMADYKLPAVGIGVLWNIGYFRQRFWFKYGQIPEKLHWNPKVYPGLIPLKNKIKISLKNEEIYLRLWKYYVYSYSHDYAVPLVLLDADVEENSEEIRRLTDQLYKSDGSRIRILQRIILGMGGILALEELGYNIDMHHLNEGHAVFAFIEKARGLSGKDIESLKKHFVYTCHTPVKAGHDRFTRDDLSKIIKKEDVDIAQEFGLEQADDSNTDLINLTLLAMNTSSCINAVSRAHQKVMHLQFPDYRERIKYVTNGVHHHTWVSERFKDLFGKFSTTLGDIKANPSGLDKIKELKSNTQFRSELWQAHQENKKDLCGFLDKWGVKKDTFTICWARRVAAYKRPSMILQDTEKLISIAEKVGPIQIIFAGKAHPRDNMGFTHISEMLDKVDTLGRVYDYLKIIMLENYDIFLSKRLVSSVDVWLNNPLPPFEASGTSGMKAILNGVVQMSTLDGWVREAADKNIGRIFGYRWAEDELQDEHDLRLEDDSVQLYATLEELVRLYYKTNKSGEVDISSPWIDMMADCLIAGADFNTYRMLDEYKQTVWKI